MKAKVFSISRSLLPHSLIYPKVRGGQGLEGQVAFCMYRRYIESEFSIGFGTLHVALVIFVGHICFSFSRLFHEIFHDGTTSDAQHYELKSKQTLKMIMTKRRVSFETEVSQ